MHELPRLAIAEWGLFVFVLDDYRLQIFSFEDLPAIQTLDIIDTVAAGQDHRFFMLAKALHTNRYVSF